MQEALTNVLKHAGPDATAQVQVSYDVDGLDVSVVDDGEPNRQPNGQGPGLIGIRERVAVVGGWVEAGPVDSGGFAVRARLPYGVQA